MVSQVAVFLLRDAVQSYTIANASNGQQDGDLQKLVNHENAVGLVQIARQNYQKTLSSSIEDNRRVEIDSFFNELESSLVQKISNESISAWLSTAIERDLAEEMTLSEGSAVGQVSNRSILRQ